MGAHPIIFLGGEAMQGGGKSDPQRDPMDDENLFQKFGAVPVSPRNYYRLMQTGQTGLLFPGGVREVFHGKDEAYKLFWPEKVDFVRTAARFNATIIPVSSVGMADSLNILLEPSEIVDLPLIGDRAKNFAAN